MRDLTARDPALTLSVVDTRTGPYSNARAQGTRRVYQPETAAARRELENATREGEPVPSGIVEKDLPKDVENSVGAAEVEAAVRSPGHAAEEWVSFHWHRDALERFVPSGARVLETTPGGGHYSEVLHRLGCKLSVLSASSAEREALQTRAR